MADFDFDKWSRGWAIGLPKNQMWRKVRDGGHKQTGEPTYQYDDKPDTSSADPAIAGVIADHRFVSPAVSATPRLEHCFCGWAGEDHDAHLRAKVYEFANPVVETPVNVEKPVVEKPAKRAKKSDDE